MSVILENFRAVQETAVMPGVCVFLPSAAFERTF